MRTWSYGEIRKKIELDLDLQNETNITPDEMVGYYNEAIQDAVAEILKLSEDYLLSQDTISLVAGTSTYSLPADIYGKKIRSLIYDDGAGIIYPIRRVRGSGENKFLDVAMTNRFSTASTYRYFIRDVSSALGSQIVIVPPPRDTGAYVTRWYIRQANYVPLVSAGSQAASDATAVDIPEFYTFIIQFMKVRCLEKDGADPRLEQATQILMHLKEMMTSTLAQMVPDDDDTIIPDTAFYWDHE